MPTFKGPLFTSGTRILDDAIEEINQQVAKRAESLIRQRLKTVLKHPTGRYMSRIRVEETHSQAIVSDSRTVYGPWLEGTGSRNRTTRFKGYATFRKVSQQIQNESVRIADAVVARYIARLR